MADLKIIDKVGSSSFKIKETVGHCSFGELKIVKYKKTGGDYFLKVIKKTNIKVLRAFESIISEKCILERLNSQFICNIRFAFQTKECVYMIYDYMSGGDLRLYLLNNSFTESQAKFIISELACGIGYLHKSYVIHRNIKPENILFHKNGHVRIGDFGFAVICDDSLPITSRGDISGYTAPEMLENSPYDESVDWWSLGVVAFELVLGKLPFEGKQPSHLLKSISNGIKFPNVMFSESFGNFINDILNPNIDMRLGAGKFAKGLDAVKRSSFLKTGDWDKIIRGEAEPKFVPGDKHNYKYLRASIIKKRSEEYGLIGRKNNTSPEDDEDDIYSILSRGDNDSSMLTTMIEKEFAPYNYYSDELKIHPGTCYNKKEMIAT